MALSYASPTIAHAGPRVQRLLQSVEHEGRSCRGVLCLASGVDGQALQSRSPTGAGEEVSRTTKAILVIALACAGCAQLKSYEARPTYRQRVIAGEARYEQMAADERRRAYEAGLRRYDAVEASEAAARERRARAPQEQAQEGEAVWKLNELQTQHEGLVRP